MTFTTELTVVFLSVDMVAFIVDSVDIVMVSTNTQIDVSFIQMSIY